MNPHIIQIYDYIRIQPRSRKMFACAFCLVGFTMYVPLPYNSLPGDTVVWLALALMFAGYWCAIYGVFCHVSEYLKTRKSNHSHV